MQEIRIENVKEGYIWLSNSQKPEIIGSNYIKTYSSIENPFVVEGEYVDNNGFSHSIRYVDGEYYDFVSDVNNIPDEDKFISETNRLNCKMIVAQIWLPEPDTLCEGKDVLKFKGWAFLGFKH